MAKKSTRTEDEAAWWSKCAPATAKFRFNPKAASNTPNCAKNVKIAEDLYKFAETYPREPATLAVVYEPACMKYYFPCLEIAEDELDMAKKIVKTQIYADVLSNCKDSSVLDRLDAQIHPIVEIHFNVLPPLHEDENEDKS